VQRELYRYVNELMIPSCEIQHYQPPSSEELCSYFTPDGTVTLDPSQVRRGHPLNYFVLNLALNFILHYGTVTLDPSQVRCDFNPFFSSFLILVSLSPSFITLLHIYGLLCWTHDHV